MTIPATTDLLQKALALHRRGAIAEAASIYAEVLGSDPANADALYCLGMISCQHGRFDEGAERARKALAGDPHHARAHVLLGRALSALGQREEALASFERAIALTPELAAAHSHRADMLSALGRNDEAVESYDRALAVAPEAVEDWFNRGVALIELGRQNEAIASFDRVIERKPDSAQAYLRRAKALSDLHRYDEALASADKALNIDNKLAEAWLGRGNVLCSLGRYDDALAAAMRALELKETVQAKALFAQCARYAPAKADDGCFRRLVLRAFSEAWTRPRELMNTCIAFVKLDETLNECIARANSAWPARLPPTELLNSPQVAAVSHNELLCSMLECAPLTDIGLERLLANVRNAMLMASMTGDAWDQNLLGFFCAIARQCFVNDYVFPATEVETEQAERMQASLENALAAGQLCSPLWPVAVGAYCPLHMLKSAEALLERSWPQCVDALLIQQVNEAAEERRIASTIPTWTSIDGEVSRAVRRQYEESPYPHWTKAGPPTLPAVLNDHRPEPLADLLFAGCGTGIGAIECARQEPTARILAIDLSLASLSYAKRMAQKFNLNNIEFVQADIMGLGAVERQFDFIEASGVLHHLADPWQGWQVLLLLLRPGGAMQIGLYSTMARQNIVAIRDLIAQRGYRPNLTDIRHCREEVAACADGSLLKSATACADFFSTNECRDLLFHVQEHRVTLPEIKSFLAANNLKFAGFNLDAPILQRFATRFPDPSAMTDLDCWHAFEISAPHTFAGMYQFGVLKPGV